MWERLKGYLRVDTATATKQKPTEKISIPSIKFVGEQSGPVEGELKNALVAVFETEPSIRTGYLVRAQYGAEPDSVVTLCLGTDSAPNEQLMKKISEIFASIFARDQHLDIIFLSGNQESNVQEVSRPFFRRG